MQWQDHELQALGNITVEGRDGTCLALDKNSSEPVAMLCSSNFLTFCEGKDGNLNYVQSMDRFTSWRTSIHVSDICSFQTIPVPEPAYEKGKTACCGELNNPRLFYYDHTPSNNNCEMIIHRIWEIQDDCGNRIQSSPQMVNYSINASFFDFALSDIVIDCENELENITGPVLLNLTCDVNLVKMTHTDERPASDSSKIIRTWSASICSGSRLWTRTQIIQISMKFQ